MKTKLPVLFIGSFLEKQRGTSGIIEKLAKTSLNQDIEFILRSSKVYQLPRLISMVNATLTAHYKLVHIDVYSGAAFIYADIISKVARIRKKPIVMTLRGGALPEFTRSNEKKVIRVLGRATVIQSPSKYLIDFYKQYNLEVRYLPNPINLSHFPYNRNQVKPYSLLWVRAFTSIYNPDIPVRVLAEVLKEFPEASLTMVGPDKGMLNEIRDLARDLGVIEHINFTGPVPNQELKEYYHTHHVFLNTTSFESFGVAVVEAAACGIPIVTNPVGEIPFIWEDERDVLFVKDNDVDTYITQVTKIFNSTELAMDLSKNAKDRAQEFDIIGIQESWKSLLLREFTV